MKCGDCFCFFYVSTHPLSRISRTAWWARSTWGSGETLFKAGKKKNLICLPYIHTYSTYTLIFALLKLSAFIWQSGHTWGKGMHEAIQDSLLSCKSFCEALFICLSLSAWMAAGLCGTPSAWCQEQLKQKVPPRQIISFYIWASPYLFRGGTVLGPLPFAVKVWFFFFSFFSQIQTRRTGDVIIICYLSVIYQILQDGHGEK